MALTCATAIGLAAAFSGCGSSSVNGNYTYNTTSTASTVKRGARSGDSRFGTWTFADGTLTATLATTNSGTVQYTVTVKATCAAPSSDFGFQVCTTIDGSSCADGAVSCPADAAPPTGTNFFLKTVEGVALFALAGSELHAGIVQGSCDANIAGDYLFSHMGVGSHELLGMYRLTANFASIIHADFGVRATSTASHPYPKEAVYTTGDANGAITPTSPACTNGVWTFGAGGGGQIKATLTDSGLFMLDTGDGDGGGILSFKESNGALLADLSGKTLQGIQFPDNSTPSPIAVTFDTAGATSITAAAKFGTISGTTITAGSPQAVTIKPASQVSDATLDLQSLVDEDGMNPYASNALHTAFANLAAPKGLFYVVPTSPTDEGTVFLSIAKLNSKLVAFGVVFNDRTGTVDPLVALPNTGAFIAFEP